MSPTNWVRLAVRVAPDAPEGWVEARLMDLGASAIQETEEGLVTYLEAPGDVGAEAPPVVRALRAEIGPAAEINWSIQPHQEWASLWRQGFEAHRFGDRLVVAPPWIELLDSGAAHVIRIDPGLAFGTAEHGSTRSCLSVLERVVAGGERVLDVGAGSGVLALSALALGAHQAVMIEIDAMACDAAGDNARANGFEDRVTIVAEPFGPQSAEGPFDLVCCNMVRGRLMPLLPVLKQRVTSGGSLLVGGLLTDERTSVPAELEGSEWVVYDEDRDDGWWSGVLRRTLI